MPKRFGIFIDNAGCERTMRLFRTGNLYDERPRKATRNSRPGSGRHKGEMMASRFAKALPAIFVTGACTAQLFGTPALEAQTPTAVNAKPIVAAQTIALDRGTAALWQSLQKLHTRASVLMVTAHPDDEDGGMLTYESRGQGARVALLTLNRGEGGANVMSSDYFDALGLVRTEELLAADRYYGAQQFWTRMVDYGFSKTKEECLEKWGHDRILADVVRVVRMTRPPVIISVFV